MKTKTANFLLKMCRTCMTQFSKRKKKSDIKDKIMCEVPKGSKKDVTIMEILQLVEPQIKVEFSDNLPTLMCSDCIKKLIIAHDFISVYRSADKKFREMLREFDNITSCKNGVNALTDSPVIIKKIDNPQHDSAFKKEDNEITKNQLQIEEIIIEGSLKKEDEDNELTKKQLQIEELIIEDIVKEEETDWPPIEVEPLHEMLEDTSDKEFLFVNSNIDSSEDEWLPESREKKTNITHDINTNHDEDNTKNVSPKKISTRNISNKKIETEEYELHVQNEDGSVQCQKCDEVLENIKLWKAHVQLHQLDEMPRRKRVKKKQIETEKEYVQNVDGSIQCQKCDEVLENIQLWQTHKRNHQLEERLKRKQLRQSNKPIKRSVKKKYYECEHCNKGFLQLTPYKSHIRMHSVETPFLCTECGKGFKVLSSLNTHMLRHKGEKTYYCLKCPMRFVCSSGLYAHMMTHSEKKPHVCDTCGKAFYLPYQLRKHILVHKGIKRYQCEYCDMRFATRDKQKRHERIHTGEKPYRCKYCDKAFIQSNECIKHLRQHLGDNVYQCELCPLRFPLYRDMRTHFATHKNDDEETRARNLKAHLEEERNLQIKFGIRDN